MTALKARSNKKCDNDSAKNDSGLVAKAEKEKSVCERESTTSNESEKWDEGKQKSLPLLRVLCSKTEMSNQREEWREKRTKRMRFVFICGVEKEDGKQERKNVCALFSFLFWLDSTRLVICCFS